MQEGDFPFSYALLSSFHTKEKGSLTKTMLQIIVPTCSARLVTIKDVHIVFSGCFLHELEYEIPYVQ